MCKESYLVSWVSDIKEMLEIVTSSFSFLSHSLVSLTLPLYQVSLNSSDIIKHYSEALDIIKYFLVIYVYNLFWLLLLITEIL